MKALRIVNKLLESDPDPDEFSPGALKDYAATSQDYLIQKQPPEIAEVLEHAPTDFVNAFLEKREAEWEPDRPFAEDWWANYDEGDDSFRQYAYSSKYRTEGGRLYQSVDANDTEGDGYSVGEAEIGTPEWKTMLEEFAYYKWMEQNAAYLKWVVEHDDDPLEYFMVVRTGQLKQLATERYRRAVKDAKLAKRRHQKNPHYMV